MKQLEYHDDLADYFPDCRERWENAGQSSIELEPGIMTSPYAPDGNLLERLSDNVTTTHEALLHGIQVSKNGDCLGRRAPEGGPYTWISYQNVYDSAQQIGSALIRNGAKAHNSQFIGIMSKNCFEWVYTEEACSMYSMVTIPLYDTLGEESIKDILHRTNLRICVCYTLEQAETIIKLKDDIQNIYIIKDFSSDNNIFLSFSKEMEISVNNLIDPVPAKPDDLLTICLTSGTTSKSKGVLLTHKNIISSISSVIISSLFGKEECCLRRGDIHISYLPMAHLFERAIQIMFFMLGQRVGFYRGDILGLLDDIQTLKPTHFPAVPRVLNKIYKKVQSSRLELSYIKRFMFDFAMKRKEAWMKSGVVTKTTVWDYLILHKLQALLGNNVRMIISGSAPLSPDVHTFLRCAFGCPVLEGYGMTESTASISFSLKNDHNTVGTVGVVLPCNLLKFTDVPEMNFYAKDGNGEICFRGPSQTQGYYHDEKITKDTIDSDGWFHTGDIGKFNEKGLLVIIDRIKFAFKLSQGEYIASEKCENICLKSVYVTQIFYDGNSTMDKPIAIVVPDETALMHWASRELDMKYSPYEDVCKHEKTKTFLLAELQEISKKYLKGFEIVCNIHIEPIPFTHENNLLTETFKMKRTIIRQHYKSILSNLYNL